MPADIVQTSHDGICGFYGYDSESYPVWWERPNQKGIEELIKTYGIDAIIMWHQYTMERIRDHMKDMGVDRFSFVIDLSGVSGMAVIMGKIGTLIKAQAKQDQEVYPEMMRKMLMINAPRGLLDCLFMDQIAPRQTDTRQNICRRKATVQRQPLAVHLRGQYPC